MDLTGTAGTFDPCLLINNLHSMQFCVMKYKRSQSKFCMIKKSGHKLVIHNKPVLQYTQESLSKLHQISMFVSEFYIYLLS